MSGAAHLQECPWLRSQLYGGGSTFAVVFAMAFLGERPDERKSIGWERLPDYTCVPARIHGVRKIWAYTISRRDLDVNARTLGDFRDGGHNDSQCSDMLFQLFFATVARVSAKIDGHSNRAGVSKSGNSDNKRSHKSQSSAEPDAVNNPEVPPEDVSNGHRSDTQHSESLTSDDSEYEYSPLALGPLVVLMEGLASNNSACDRNLELCGLRFWVLSREANLDMDPELARIISENYAKTVDLAAKNRRRKRRWSETSADAHASRSTKWQDVDTYHKLALLVDRYIGYDYFRRACPLRERLVASSGGKAKSGPDPMSASALFNYVWALRAVPDECNHGQSSVYFTNYFEKDPTKHMRQNATDGTFTFRVPYPELMCFIPRSDATPDIMIRRPWPTSSNLFVHPLVRRFPVRFKEPVLVAGATSGIANKPVYRKYCDENVEIEDSSVPPLYNNLDDDGIAVDSILDALLEHSRHGTYDHSERSEQRSLQTRTVCSSDRFQELLNFENLGEIDVTKLDPHDRRNSATGCINQLDAGPRDVSNVCAYLYADAFTRAASRTESAQRAATGAVLRARLAGEDNVELLERIMTIIVQSQALVEYNESCRSPESDISEVGRNLHDLRMRRNMYAPEYPRPECVIHDLRYSVFANDMIAMYARMAKEAMATGDIPLLTRLYYTRYDAYRAGHDMHAGCLQYGPQAAGKSFGLNLVEQNWCPPNCVTNCTYRSALADAASGNGSDTIHVFHEMPPDMIATRTSGSSSTHAQVAQFKERLTSGWMTGEVLVLDKTTGERHIERIVRNVTGVTFCAMNPTKLFIDPALQSRFFMAAFGKADNVEPIIAAKAAFEIDRSRRLAEQNLSDSKDHLMLLLHYEVEKMIAVGALNQVSEGVALCSLLYIMSTAAQSGVKPDDTRWFRHVMLMARTMTISEALRDLFFRPGAPYLDQAITTEKLMRLDQRLYIQSNELIYALGVSESQLTSGYERTIPMILEQMIKTGRVEYARNAKNNIPYQQMSFHRRPEFDNDPNYVVLPHALRRPKQVYDLIAEVGKKVDGINVAPTSDNVREWVTKYETRQFPCMANMFELLNGKRVSRHVSDPNSNEENRPIIKRDDCQIMLLVQFIENVAATSATETPVVRAIRNFFSFKNQKRGAYAYGGQPPHPGSPVVRLIMLGPNTTPAEIKEVEGTEFGSTTGAPKRVSKGNLIINNVTYTEQTWKIMQTDRHASCGPVVTPAASADLCDPSDRPRHDVESRFFDVDVPIDVWAAKERWKVLNMCSSAVDPNDVKLSGPCDTQDRSSVAMTTDRRPRKMTWEPGRCYFMGDPCDTRTSTQHSPGEPLEEAPVGPSRGADADFDPEEHLVPIPVSMAQDMKIVWQRYVGDNVLVYHWEYMGVDESVYRVIHTVWFVTTERARLWQLYSGRFHVSTFNYPGDFEKTSRFTSFARRAAEASKDRSLRMSATKISGTLGVNVTEQVIQHYNGHRNPVTGRGINSMDLSPPLAASREPATDGGRSSSSVHDDLIEPDVAVASSNFGVNVSTRTVSEGNAHRRASLPAGAGTGKRRPAIDLS